MEGVNIGTNMEQNAEKKNYSQLKAILFAILFGLIGCVIFYFVYNLGVIAYIGAYLIYYLAVIGYKKGMGFIDKKGFLLVFLISAIELVLALCLNIIVFIMIEYDVSFGTSVELFKYYMQDGDISSIISDVIFSFVFLIISAVSCVKMEKRKSSRTIVNDYSANANGVPYQGSNGNNYTSSEMTSSGTIVNDFSVNQNDSTQTTVNEVSNNSMDNQNSNYNENYTNEQSVEDLFKDIDDGTNNF